MIKKLRHKFILINMILVTSVLIITLSIICIAVYRSQKEDLSTALDRSLMYSENMPLQNDLNSDPMKSEDFKPDEKKVFELGVSHGDRDWNFADVALSFIVFIDSDGNISKSHMENIEVSDDLLNEAVNTVLSSTKLSGEINSLSLMYKQLDTSDGTLISFVDTTSMKSYMKDLILTLLLVGFCGFFAFFIISIFLSKWAVQPVAKAWEQQRQFVADASHELKTPLTVILANAGIILHHREDTVAKQEKWLQYINDEAERMKKLVEGMLFLAKSDASRLPAVHSDVNLSDIVWNTVLPFESVAFENGLTLNSEIQPDITCHGDEGQLKELVGIFLDNACKYADEHGTVSIKLEKPQEHIRLTIHNTGSFIPEEKRKNLFERFYRADDSRDRKAGGYGLGLSIAKSIAEHHHAKIVVSSDQEKGTSFTIIF